MIRNEFSEFLDPDVTLEGTDVELADLRKKLLAVTQVIEESEVVFALNCYLPPLIGWTSFIGGVTIDEIVNPTDASRVKLRSLTAITDRIRTIMNGDRLQ